MKKPVILLSLLACMALVLPAFAAADPLYLPSETQVIEDEAYRGCTNLSGVLLIPEGVTEIGAYAFAGCTALTGVPRIPGSVERIGAHAFDGCTGLSGLLYLPEDVNVDATAFNGTGLVLTHTRLAAPYITQITAHRDGSVSVSWSSVPEAESYTLYYAEAADGALADGSRISGITDTQIDLAGLSFKTDYLFAVTASNGDYESAMSAHAQARIRGINYRALLIGEVHFEDDTCSRNEGDCNLMYSMLTSRFTPIGTRYMTPGKYIDRSANQILSLVGSRFAGADEDDVSLFFIATHGDSVTTYQEWYEAPGSLNCVDSNYMESWLDLCELADALQAVPGEVIVIIESCGSGAAVYDPAHPEQQNAASRLTADAIANAFPAEKLDRSEDVVYVYDENGNGQIVRSRVGEFRVPDKFYVLCASRYLQDSWGTESAPAHNYFTQWLTDGVGTTGRMPADSDLNGVLTLNELFSYISSVGDNRPFGQDRETQQVQVYPTGSPYELFRAEPIF